MNSPFNYFIKRRIPLLIFVLIIFVFGIGFGAIGVKTVEYSNKQELFNFFNNFMQGINEINYNQGTMVSESIRFNLINILVIWLFGMSVILMPLIPVLLFFKGFVLSFSVGFLISEYSLKGVLYSLVTIFPQNLLIIPAFIIAGILAIHFCVRIINFYRKRERLSIQDFFAYTISMFLLAIMLFMGSLIETYISPYLFKLLLRFL
ncbi:MAG: stage II sporulation protein M [Nanoarchaeota archaeon]